MLRNLVDRAFSHYLMDYRLGLISSTLEEVIECKSYNKKSKLFYQQYIELGLYFKQVKRYLEIFGSENVHIILYQDFKNDIEVVIKKVYHFLHVDSKFEPKVEKKYNTFIIPKNNFIRIVYSFVGLRKFLKFFIPENLVKRMKNTFFKKDEKPELSLKLRKKMNELFLHDINLLEDLLSKDLSIWKK